MSGSHIHIGEPFKDKNRYCPSCGTRLDGATEMIRADEPAADRMPVGSITVCAYCFTMLEVREADFREVTGDERQKILADHPYLVNILKLLKERR